MKYPDIVFECRKCEHTLYVDKKEVIKKMLKPIPDCPNCGEDGYANWILLGEGNFKMREIK